MATVIQAPARPSFENRVRLSNVRWETYEALVEDLTEQHVRMVYDHGELEMLVTESSRHAWLGELLGHFVLVLAEELGMPIRSCGTTTFKRRDRLRGLEGDKVFYVANELAVRCRDDIDLATDPPPDLAIEVDLSSYSINKLDVYAGLGVPEVWSFDGESLSVLVLKDDVYEERNASVAFPRLPMDRLVEFLERRHQVDETTLIGEFREWARSVEVE